MIMLCQSIELLVRQEMVLKHRSGKARVGKACFDANEGLEGAKHVDELVMKMSLTTERRLECFPAPAEGASSVKCPLLVSSICFYRYGGQCAKGSRWRACAEGAVAGVLILSTVAPVIAADW